MRTLVKIMLAAALALTVSSSASALVSVTLTQIGGTYNGSAAAGTLVLSIDYSITGATPSVTIIDPAIDIGGVATLISGTETGPALWEFGGVSASPIGVTGADITTAAPGQLDGWEKASLSPFGTAGSCVFDNAVGGSCGTLGTVTLQLTGLAGVIDLGSIVQPTPFGTIISDATFVDVTASQSLGTFSVIPEPTTASLLGLGLLGLTVAGRPRKN